jgi:NitT/TauT family transport system substrate-binding protein
MNAYYRRVAAVVLAVIVVMTLTACDQQKQKKPEELNYRLKWLFNISVVGDLYTDVEGIFAEQGLRVAVKEGGPERDAIKELELGHAQFGVASADQIIRAAAKGSPIAVLIQLFQENPLSWIYRPDKIRIDSAEDLKGKTIGITYGGNDETIMRALLARYHIREDEVTLFSVRYDYTPFYEGQVDLWPIYRNAEGIIIGEKLRKAGESFRFMNPADFGIRFVANSVITTHRMLDEHPDTVRRFVVALLKGWRQALDPATADKAISMLAKFDKDTPKEIMQLQLSATRELMLPTPDFAFGTIDRKAWVQTEEIMRAQNQIAAPVDVEKLLVPIAEK